MKNIRNFSIIAHIDHGKSTLADRMLEETETIEDRDMQEQMLDQMELERERGITIKMTPARMIWKPNNSEIRSTKSEIRNGGSDESKNPERQRPRTSASRQRPSAQVEEYILNLIDTPGHIDFSYEVSRALKAVEGVVLLVDATQGVQAQTFTTLDLAKEHDLEIIPAVSKVDSPRARTEEVKKELADLIDCDPKEVVATSGETGEGVGELLSTVVKRVPAPESKETPQEESSGLTSLVFDFDYSSHQGVVVYVRIFDGKVEQGMDLSFAAADADFTAKEVGVFSPEPMSTDTLSAGDIGYIVTGIKEPGIASVGDTVCYKKDTCNPLPGYETPAPVVWASIFPESGDDFTQLRNALQRLKLSDSSLSFQQESSSVLGRGFRCGFLGMLHLEIVTERLRREFDIELVVTTPTITYEVTDTDGNMEMIYSPTRFPEYHEIEKVREPWVKAHLITPAEYISGIMQLLHDRSAQIESTEMQDDERTVFMVRMPLRELMRNFFDDLKRVSSGYASLSYEIEEEYQDADVVRLQILVTEEVVPAFSRIVADHRAEEEARSAVERLHDLLPRQLYKQKIQARAKGRIIASETISAIKQDAAADLYGGDISRKKKLRERQKEGRKELEDRASTDIPQDVFLKMMRGDN